MKPAVYGPGKQVIQSWPLANGQELRLTSCYFKRSRFLDLRRWERAGGEWRPTARGIRLSDSLAGPLATALTRIAEGSAA